MDFDQFLERDILSFLDGKIEHKRKGAVDREEEYGLYLTKDYMKELTSSLDNDELTKAKRLFDELKQTYNNLPKNSLERKKIYNLLEQMYSKIEAYVQMRTRSSPGTPVPLVISKAVESKGHGNKLDVQSSIMEDQLERLDKKFSTKEEPFESQAELPATENKLGDSEKSLDTKTIPELVDKKPGKDDLKELSMDNIHKQSDIHTDMNKMTDINRLSNKKSDEHKNKSHEKSPDKPVEIYKVPRKIAKDTPKEQKQDVDIKKSIDESSKNMPDDKAEILKQMSISMSKIDTGGEDIHLYKVPREDTHKIMKNDPVREVNSEKSLENEKIESYKIIKEQHHEKVQEPVISELDEAKYLEGLATIERMYFEGIYLFYNHNYQEASKLFEKVLDARPRSKAAKIRLHECMEAMESE